MDQVTHPSSPRYLQGERLSLEVGVCVERIYMLRDALRMDMSEVMQCLLSDRGSSTRSIPLSFAARSTA